MLTNFDLFNISKERSIILHNVIMRDQLKSIRRKSNQYLIINLDHSNNQGTHWVCLIIQGKNAIYFDSFGAIPPKEVISYCKGLKLGYSSYIVQNLKSEACGWYCIALLHYIQTNNNDIYENYNDYINMFEDNTEQNDKKLYIYMRKE